MLASPSGGVDGLFRLAGSRNGPSTMWFIKAIAIYASSRLEIVSLTPLNWRSAPASAIQAPPAAMPASAIRLSSSQGGADGGRDEAAHHERALAADDDEAKLGRQRHAQRGQQQRGGPLQGILPREPGAEGAPVHQ